jgi:hypothetical protein
VGAERLKVALDATITGMPADADLPFGMVVAARGKLENPA